MTETVELPDDPTTLAHWTAALEGRLVLQHCAACGHVQHYPRPVCLDCGSGDLEWRDSSATGTVYSLTQVTLKVSDLEPPYVVALVELDEGVRVLGIAEDTVVIGGWVRGELRQRPGSLPRLHVEPA